MHRRQFLSSSIALGGALAGTSILGRRSTAARPPNILFIHVDEMRFPTVFPSGINDVDGFLAMFMPNTFKLLWQRGVKFANHHTAASACTPARGAFTTGLYSQQNWVTQTVRDFPGFPAAPQPGLDPAFPTYGSLLQQAGYQTPYIGKWHISIPQSIPEDSKDAALAAYGFDDYRTLPDPTGANLQGTVGFEPDFHSDEYIANKAATWLNEHARESPWCLTVGFQNPHDKAWFWAGTEYQTYSGLFPAGKPPPIINWADEDLAKDIPFDQNPLKNPPSIGYPIVPPNWESAKQIAAHKPSTQSFWRLFIAANWGGISDDPRQSQFTTARYPTVPSGEFTVGIAPFSYWQRALDLYTQVMSQVDIQIGTVIDALPRKVARNTVIVFTADHGDYAGAHGFVSDKMGSCYAEIVKVPLIVVDPTGQFAGEIGTVRSQLTSAVDLVPMLVSLAHNGSRDWISGNLIGVYGRRHDMIPLLGSASALGRPYVLFTYDELAPLYKFDNSPAHVLMMLTEKGKLGIYSNWLPSTTTIDTESIEVEFYDYQTEGGRLELHNTPDHPRAKRMQQRLLNDIVPKELQAPLPPPFTKAQAKARTKAIAYEAIADKLELLETGAIVGF